ncbi:MAG TPA: Replicase polyprotein 1ab [Actinoplanes sp.]|nr:Replicase polyprotein 1ab [Actinoplanes sp.]
MARHLVAAGQIIDEDADLALQHAIAARRIASRIGVVREAVGLAAYAAGDWPTAIAELRTYHRMSGKQTHLAEIADSERALGRPERAIDLYRGADRDALDKAGAIELLIVAAGARGDLGQHDAAVAMLQVRELTAEEEDEDWTARLRYAYADALLAAGRREEAREWFSRAATADPEHLTDASERLLELDGVVLEDDEPDEDEPTTAGDETVGDVVDVAESDGAGAADEVAAVADIDGAAVGEQNEVPFQDSSVVDDSVVDDAAVDRTDASIGTGAAAEDTDEKAEDDEFVAAGGAEPPSTGAPQPAGDGDERRTGA